LVREGCDVVLKLLDLGASVDANADGRTPLHLYCSTLDEKSPIILKRLIKAGSNVNQQVKRS
jgi:ankyrin repeat protein